MSREVWSDGGCGFIQQFQHSDPAAVFLKIAARYRIRLRPLANPDKAISAASAARAHSPSVGTCCTVPLPVIPGPPWSTIAPLGVRSSSPRPPSVMLKVAVLPESVAGSSYQCGFVSAAVGPYLRYFAPGGIAAG